MSPKHHPGEEAAPERLLVNVCRTKGELLLDLCNPGTSLAMACIGNVSTWPASYFNWATSFIYQ